MKTRNAQDADVFDGIVMIKQMLIVIISCLLFSVGFAHAQPVIGGKAGPAFSKWQRVDPPSGLELHYRAAVSAGVAFHLRNWEPFIPQLEVLFTNKGTRSTFEGEYLGQRSFNYIQIIPIFRPEAKFGTLTIYGLAGPNINILLSAELLNAFGVGTDITDSYSRVDFGVLIGGGGALGPFSWGTVSIEARYDLGVVDLGIDSEISVKNRTISFMLGYEYRRDRDGDGIPDGKDRCPDEPEDRDGFQDSDGCPDPDNDGDGVADREDTCPDAPAAERARLRGCPEEIATRGF